MECTASRAARLMKWLDTSPDISSDSSSSSEAEDNTVAGGSNKSQSFAPPVKHTEQAVEIIVISSGDESSDLDDEGAAEAKVKRTACGNGAKAAGTTAPSMKEIKRRGDECKQVMQKWKSLEAHTQDAPANQPAIEVDGILAAAIEEYSKLEDDDQLASHGNRGTWIGQESIEGDDQQAVVEAIPPESKSDQQHSQVPAAREAGTQWLRSNEYDGDVDSELDGSQFGKHFEPKTAGNRERAGRLAPSEKELRRRRSEQLELEKRKPMLVAEPRVHHHIKKPKEQQKPPRISQKPSGETVMKTKNRKPPQISQNPSGHAGMKMELRELPAAVQALRPGNDKGILKTPRVAKGYHGQHTQDKVTKGRISKKHLIALAPKTEPSSRQQLLNTQVKLRKVDSVEHQQQRVRATDSDGKTSLARRNKRRRQNKSIKKRGASIE